MLFCLFSLCCFYVWYTIFADDLRISGTLPAPSAAGRFFFTVTALLLHNLRLSGSLPHKPQSMAGPFINPNVSMKVLTLARNYMIGDIKSLDHFTNLESLLISSNYFSCAAAGMNGATHLATGMHFSNCTQYPMLYPLERPSQLTNHRSRYIPRTRNSGTATPGEKNS